MGRKAAVSKAELDKYPELRAAIEAQERRDAQAASAAQKTPSGEKKKKTKKEMLTTIGKGVLSGMGKAYTAVGDYGRWVDEKNRQYEEQTKTRTTPSKSKSPGKKESEGYDEDDWAYYKGEWVRPWEIPGYKGPRPATPRGTNPRQKNIPPNAQVVVIIQERDQPVSRPPPPPRKNGPPRRGDRSEPSEDEDLYRLLGF